MTFWGKFQILQVIWLSFSLYYYFCNKVPLERPNAISENPQCAAPLNLYFCTVKLTRIPDFCANQFLKLTKTGFAYCVTLELSVPNVWMSYYEFARKVWWDKQWLMLRRVIFPSSRLTKRTSSTCTTADYSSFFMHTVATAGITAKIVLHKNLKYESD